MFWMLIWFFWLWQLTIEVNSGAKEVPTEKYPEFERHLFVQAGDTLPYRLMRPLQAEAQKSYP
ncbi:MAG: hypothetical protein HC913_16920 [Microscillaceae bacterium]|nr:hypothetical protein [Microscillaceae bacterium]